MRKCFIVAALIMSATFAVLLGDVAINDSENILRAIQLLALFFMCTLAFRACVAAWEDAE